MFAGVIIAVASYGVGLPIRAALIFDVMNNDCRGDLAEFAPDSLNGDEIYGQKCKTIQN